MRRWLATNLLELLRDAAAGGFVLVVLLVLLWLSGLMG
jgi:hypothetical protein